ncbi:MAG TPA: peptide-N4-asparagine amidase [Chthoniobacterales bacterium]|nr:peptide-N4-asparagine amidase [Chthoniobacterales bacterium]
MICRRFSTWLTGLMVVASFGFGNASYAGSPIGSGNTITADPPVSRPPAKFGAPAKVQLFDNFEFNSFNPQAFSYTPPNFTPPPTPDSPRPWAKVILVCDLNVTPGIQYDRTARMTIGNTVVYIETTSEPTAKLGPSWHIERDLTEYSNLLMSAQPGEINIGNSVNGTYTGVIYASAYLLFYPYTQGSGEQAPVVADLIYPLPGTPDGSYTLQSGTGTLSLTFTVPRQVQTIPTTVARAYIDVFAQSQYQDEFWYSNVPDNLARQLNQYGGTSFREVEVSIDGQVAGFAPVYPWIYTGGIDPYLWAPIPGVQALTFVPYRIDLSPFAVPLSDGNSHTVSLNVYNANNYFLASANLLVYLNYNSSSLTGGVTVTGDYQPALDIQENIHQANGYPNGTIGTRATRHLTVEGYVVVSPTEKLVTKVEQDASFSNDQRYVVSPTHYEQDILQLTKLTTKSTYQDLNTAPGKSSSTLASEKELSYPLTANIVQTFNSDGSGQQKTNIDQGYLIDEVGDWVPEIGLPLKVAPYTSHLSNVVKAVDTLLFNSSFQITGNQGQASSQTYSFDATAPDKHYLHTIKAANGVVTYDHEEGSAP